MDKLDMAVNQNQYFENNKPRLSSTPNYIYELSIKLSRIEYKLDLLLAEKETQSVNKG